MNVNYPHIPLIRINAPEIFADAEFKQWFFNRPKRCASAKYAPAIATWHPSQESEFGEYSDFFTTVDGHACGDHAEGDGSESDIPRRLWRQLVTAAWQALDRPHHFECLLWVSNLPNGTEQAGLDDAGRLQLVRDLYTRVYHNSESFEKDTLGADLAYLMGAVVEGSFCQWDPSRPLLRLLRGHFSKQHAIWGYIHVEGSQGGEAVRHSPSERELATILAALRFWQHHGKMDADPCNEVATDSGRLQPLCDDEIDGLCERLNCGT